MGRSAGLRFIPKGVQRTCWWWSFVGACGGGRSFHVHLLRDYLQTEEELFTHGEVGKGFVLALICEFHLEWKSPSILDVSLGKGM